jgi:phage host-nuclease inhibitor protein Gam
MASARLKTAAQKFNVATQDDCIAMIRQIGDLERQKVRMTADADDKINEIKQNLGHGIEPISGEIAARQDAVQSYAESNRDRLTNGGKSKSIEYTTGIMGWRQRPPSVSVRAADVVVETLKKLGLARFIRSKEEINKEAILQEPDAARGIAGLTINTGVEDFYIQPSDSTGTMEAKAA